MSADFLLPADLVEFSQSFAKTLNALYPTKVLREHLLDPHGLQQSTLHGQSTLEGHAADPPSVNHSQFWSVIHDSGSLMACLPEAVGGLGFGAVASQLIVSEAGRTLTTSPLAETITFALTPLLACPSSPVRDAFLRGFTEDSRYSLGWSGAFEPLLGGAELAISSPTAAPGAETFLSGTVDFVPSVDRISHLVVPAVDSQNNILLAVLTDRSPKYSSFDNNPGVIRNFRPALDLLRPYFSLSLDKAPAKVIGSFSRHSPEVSTMVNQMKMLMASEMAGAAKQAVAMAVDYAKTRRQFGKTIGSFQAIAHQLADMHLHAESALSLCRFAAWAVDKSREQSSAACLAAKAYASEMLPKIALKSIQVHGGIGFTYEYELHYFVRRIRALAQLGGSAEACSSSLAEIDYGERLS